MYSVEIVPGAGMQVLFAAFWWGWEYLDARFFPFIIPFLSSPNAYWFAFPSSVCCVGASPSCALADLHTVSSFSAFTLMLLCHLFNFRSLGLFFPELLNKAQITYLLCCSFEKPPRCGLFKNYEACHHLIYYGSALIGITFFFLYYCTLKECFTMTVYTIMCCSWEKKKKNLVVRDLVMFVIFSHLCTCILFSNFWESVKSHKLSGKSRSYIWVSFEHL